jgi:DNA-binding NarL/FixJ family response regulator
VGQARVLLVDDHPVFRRGLAALLAVEEWVRDVLEAGDVAGALEAVRARRPDVVVLDLGLPDGSGVDAVRPIRLAYPGTVVLVLTMDEDDVQVRRVLAAGASGYLLKQSEPEAVVAAVRTVLLGGSVLGAGVARPAVPAPGPPPPFDGLTPRQLAVARAVAAGRSTTRVGRELGIADKTVRNILSSVLAATGTTDRVALALLARERGLRDDDD